MPTRGFGVCSFQDVQPSLPSTEANFYEHWELVELFENASELGLEQPSAFVIDV